ncbi:MAG TPA: TonB-dependent receptor [Burkholderiaceae bacterium]|jgi:iron complex outermembrane receptor protein
MNSFTKRSHARQRLAPAPFGLKPVAAVCALLAAPLAYAQTDAATPTNQLDTVVVSGIRQSIENSIALKRNSDSVIEAITSEDIGKLPDISIAESLSRLPGLAAQRVNGRAQGIAIRGMSPDFSGTLLNGREQTTTGTNRGVEFDQYPAELMNSVLVYKTPDATLLGQGISGTVDLRTVRPLDVSSRTIALNARAERNSLGDLNHGYGGTGANGARVSASYIDQFADRTIGVAVGIAHLDSPGQETHYKAWGFQTDDNCLQHQTDWGCSPVTGATPGSAYYMSGFEATTFSRNDKRDGLMGVVEYKPSKDLHSTIDLYYSKFKQTEVMRGLMGSIGDGWGTPGSVFSNIGTTPVGDGSLVTSGTTTMVPNMVVRNDYNKRDDTLKAIGWNTEAKLGGWTAVGDLSYSSAKRVESLFETYAGSATSPLITFNIPTTPAYPTLSSSINYGDPSLVALRDPAGWGHMGRQQFTTQNDVMKNARLDFKHELGWIFPQIDFGVNFNKRDKTRDFNVLFATLKNGGTSQLLSSGDVLPSSSLGFVGLPGTLAYDVNAVAAKYYTMTQNLSLGPTGDLSHDFGVHERITTAFVKTDIETELGGIPIHGNMGLQYIHTKQDSNAFAFDPNGGAVIGSVDPGITYSNMLPSLNLVGDIGGNRMLRFGLARELMRPRIDDMNASSSAGVSTTSSLWSGSGGNPRLKPWLANAADLSLEQYFGKRSYVAGAIFFKKLQTYIYNSTVPYDFTGFVNSTPTVTPVSNIGQYTTQANGSGGNMRGLELSSVLDGTLLSSALDGFGVQATFSLTDSSIQANGPLNTATWQSLPGLSKRVANLQLFYEKYGYSFRISDRYRSDFRGEYTSLFGNTTVLRTLAQNIVDVQASYELQGGPAKGLQFLAQIVNLTNTPDKNVQDGSGFGGNVTAPQEFNKYGRTYLFGVNYKFQ